MDTFILTSELTDHFQASLKTKKLTEILSGFIKTNTHAHQNQHIKDLQYEFLVGLAHSTLESLRERCLYTSRSQEIGSL